MRFTDAQSRHDLPSVDSQRVYSYFLENVPHRAAGLEFAKEIAAARVKFTDREWDLFSMLVMACTIPGNTVFADVRRELGVSYGGQS
jgi:hypothetical protein